MSGERARGVNGVRRALVLGCALTVCCALGCSAGPPARPGPSPTARGSAVVTSAAGPEGVRVLPLSDAAPRSLEVTLRPGLDDALAVAVHDELGEPDGAARLLGPDGPLGPPLELEEGEHVVTAAALTGATVLITSHENQLCLRKLGRARDVFEPPRCGPSAAVALATRGSTLALFEVEPIAQPKAAAGPRPAFPSKGSKPAASPAKKPAKKDPAKTPTQKPPKKKPTQKPSTKKPPSKKAPQKTPSRGEPVRVFARLVAHDAGEGLGERRDTGLAFERTAGGVDLVAAAGRDGLGPGGRLGFDLVFLERARKPGKGQLTLARLDADATLERGGRTSLLEAALDFGGLDGHVAPRLVGRDAYARLYTLPKKPVQAGKAPPACTAISLASPLAHLGKPSPSAAVCAFQPSAKGLSLEAHTQGDALKVARRHPFQPSADAPLGALADGTLYTLEGGTVRTWAAGRALAGAASITPLVARRDELRAASFAPSGEALMVLGERLVRVSPEGARVDAGSWPRTAPPRYVHIGASFRLERGAHGALERAPAEAPELVARYEHQGEERTVELSLVGGASALVVRDARGLELSRLAPSPVEPGFALVSRGERGALVVGERERGRVALAVSPSGALGRAVPVEGRGAFSLELVSHAGGELTLIDAEHVRWLDGEGRELSRAPVPAGPCEARGQRSFVALPEPGRLVRLAELSPEPPGASRCIVSAPTISNDGALRAATLRRSGLDRVAELVVVPRVGATARPRATTTPAQVGPPAPRAAPSCPRDMVRVGAHGFCIDRYESTLFDGPSWRLLEHDHPPTPGLLEAARGEWSTELERRGNLHARALPLPPLASWRRGARTEPHALVRRFALPNGYVTGLVADEACRAAGKRLCTHEEHVTACRGEDDTLHPYGDDFEDGACNVFREVHPAAVLHGNASIGHLDPRLPHVRGERGPLLRPTGSTPRCKSRWGDDAAYDLVGNVDEWVELEGGAFAGGFYSRSTRNGCEALVTAHPRSYADYSTGVRCCRNELPGSPEQPE